MPSQKIADVVEIEARLACARAALWDMNRKEQGSERKAFFYRLCISRLLKRKYKYKAQLKGDET